MGNQQTELASNVDDLELAKQLQNFIELEDAPLKRKLTNPMPPGSYYTKPKKSNEMIAAGGGHASSTFSQVNLEICLLSLVAPLNIRAIWLNWPE
jgi:hypothetical protein